MEIIIRTEGNESVVRADVGGAGSTPSSSIGAPSSAEGAVPPEAAAAKAMAIGATNGGAAPSAPGETGVPPVNVTAAADAVVPSDGAGESAGAAPATP